MTVETTPGFLQEDSYTAEILRRTIGAAYQRGASIGTNVGGLVAASDCQITPESALKVQVAPGELWVPGYAAPQGLYYTRVTAAEVLTPAATTG